MYFNKGHIILKWSLQRKEEWVRVRVRGRWTNIWTNLLSPLSIVNSQTSQAVRPIPHQVNLPELTEASKIYHKTAVSLPSDYQLQWSLSNPVCPLFTMRGFWYTSLMADVCTQLGCCTSAHCPMKLEHCLFTNGTAWSIVLPRALIAVKYWDSTQTAYLMRSTLEGMSTRVIHTYNIPTQDVSSMWIHSSLTCSSHASVQHIDSFSGSHTVHAHETWWKLGNEARLPVSEELHHILHYKFPI